MRKMKILSLVSFFLIASAFAAAVMLEPGNALAEEAVKNLVIMGWDGADYENLRQLLKEDRLPNIARFLDSYGGHIVPVDLIATTETVPSWVQIFSGLTYDQSGVLGNRGMKGALVGKPPKLASYNRKHAVFPYFNFWIRTLPYEQTIFKVFQDRGYKTAWVVSKSVILGNMCERSPLCRIARNADFYYACNPVPREDTLSETLRLKEIDDTYLEHITEKSLEFIKESGGRYVLFCHVDQDIYGHRHGKSGERYNEEFIRADESLGAILDAIDPQTTRVMIITDHGFDGVDGHSHKNAPHAWMITDLPVHPLYHQQEGQRAFANLRDIAPTLLDWHGIDYSGWMPQIRGRSLLE